MKHEPILAGLLLSLSLLRLPALAQDAAPAANAAADVAANTATTTVAPLTNTAADPPALAATNAAGKAAAVAEQQGMEEKFKQLAADIQTLRTANQLVLDNLSALKDDLQQIRTAQARLAAGAISREDLKPLAQKIEEVDKRRQEDKDAISEDIKKTSLSLQKLITETVESALKPLPKPAPPVNPTAAETGFSYTIKAGDTLDAIVAAYNADFKSKGWKTITRQQAKDANQNVDWNHLKIGQRIIVPRPAD